MNYKFGDKIVVGENPMFGPIGEGTVVGVTEHPHGNISIFYLLDSDTYRKMPAVEADISSGYPGVLVEHVTPLDNNQFSWYPLRV